MSNAVAFFAALLLLTALPAAAQTIQVSSGDDQTGTVAKPLPKPLQVKVSLLGLPLKNMTVRFAVIDGGGGLSDVEVVTDKKGIASRPKLTLGVLVGVNTVTATGTLGNANSVTFTAIAKPGAPAKLTLSPSTATAQTLVPISYAARVLDAHGNFVTSGPTAAVTFTATGTTGTFAPAATVAASNGTASVSFTATSASPSATITASATGLTSATAALTVVSASPAKLALLPANASARVGTAVTFSAQVQDASGALVTAATNSVTFTATGVSGSFSPGSVVAASNGVATVSFTPSATGTATIRASASGLTGATATLQVTSGVAVKLSLTPATATTRTGTAVSYTATVQDANGNTVSAATNPVSFSVSGVAGTFSPAGAITPGAGVAKSNFTPSQAGRATITATSSGLTASSATLTVSNPVARPPQSLFTTQTPALTNATDGVSYELGMKFRLARPGVITALRYWKSPSDFGTHVGNLWAADGTLLATVTFAGETASGWQQQALAAPVRVQADKTYVISVNIVSNYPFTSQGLMSSVVNGDIASVADGSNGVLSNPGHFPTSAFQSSNYFRDIVFVADSVPLIAKVSGDNQHGAASSTLPAPLVVQVRDGNDDPSPNVLVTFALKGGGSVSPTSAVTDASGKASATLRLGASGLSRVTATASGVGSVTFKAFVPNRVWQENQQPGSTAWRIGNPVTASAPEIAGYASATSVNIGGTLPLKVTLAQAGQYIIDVYRLGYYGAAGGRLMGSFGPFVATVQPPCGVTDSNTLLIECRWSTSYVLSVGSSWTSGLYVANLTAQQSGKQSQIWFVVRDPSSQAELLFQSSFNTFVAYNNYGDGARHSLYPYNSTAGRRAFKVSFDRPFSAVTTDVGTTAANSMMRYERNMARWLESQGYDVTYVSNLDVHHDGTILRQHKTFLSVGHDEYWSLEMRNGVEQARDAGINLGFFSANSAYWRVRFEPSSSAEADRVMVCYKDPLDSDPVAPTYLWRGPENNRPENALLGVMYVGDNDQSDGFDYVVSNAGDRYYDNTQLTNGMTVKGIVGYEWDAVVSNGLTPPGLVILSSSSAVPTTAAPNLPLGTSPAISNAVRYTATSGAKVFSTGSIQFAWGLDSNGVFPPRDDGRIKQFTINVLSDLGAVPLSADESLIVP